MRSMRSIRTPSRRMMVGFSGGAVSGDVTTLEDLTILAKLQQDEE